MNKQLQASCLLVAILGAALMQGAAAQTRQPVTAAMARIDPMTVSIQTITPSEAHTMKASFGPEVLLIDIRSREEIVFTGIAEGVDAIVPYRQVAQPVRWDEVRKDIALEPTAGFVHVVQAWAATLGGSHDTILLLLCSDGERAAAAARELTLAGFANVRPVAGGFEGVLAADGRRHGGWKDTQPWYARADEERLFGRRD